MVTPKDILVSSEGGTWDGADDCASKHMFHEACMPLEYVLRQGCPLCRRYVNNVLPHFGLWELLSMPGARFA